MKIKGFADIVIIVIVLAAVGVGFWWFKNNGLTNEVVETVAQRTNKQSLTLRDKKGFDFNKATAGYDKYQKLIDGCPSKDCIPSLDSPQFATVADSDTWLEDDDVVFALHYKGENKAYPQRILNWHEIVNDKVAGDLVSITFCPLSGSALVFDRQVDDQTVEFGVSGKLYNNNLVMYDRQTNTLWQQITGEAMVGELFGKKLKQISIDSMRWGEFKEQYPSGQILSRNTGFDKDYNVSPYATYEQDRNTLFPLEVELDQTIHPKTVVYGVEVNNKQKAYSTDELREKGAIEDSVGGVRIRLSYYNGDINVMNLQTKEEIVATRIFWFAWKAFHPETELY